MTGARVIDPSLAVSGSTGTSRIAAAWPAAVALRVTTSQDTDAMEKAPAASVRSVPPPAMETEAPAIGRRVTRSRTVPRTVPVQRGSRQTMPRWLATTPSRPSLGRLSTPLPAT
ncbi:MAG: hypothetical protein IPN17_29025 [Deltaproteobacteria bacterium]|nr:hypothetical protein [Deltaproteobacteria bacterium]